MKARIGLLLFLALLGTPAVAPAPTFFSPGRVLFSALGTPENGSQVYCTDCTEGSKPCTSGGSGAMALRVNGAWNCLDSGGGSGASGFLNAPSCMDVTGAVTPLFMADGSCIDQTEARVEQKINQAITLSRLQCITSVDPGASQTIVVTGRSGTCGALSDSGTFTCTLTGGSGRATCTSGAATLSIGAGGCWSIKLVPTSGVADGTVSCTTERSS